MHIHEYQSWLEEWDRSRDFQRTLPSHTLLHALEELGEISKLIQQIEGYRPRSTTDLDELRDELALELSDLQVMIFKIAYLCEVDMEAALITEVDDIKNNLPSEEEMARVRAQVVASSIFEQDSSFYQGMKIGVLETVGLGWQTNKEFVEKIKAVTAEQVQQVARKYLVEEHLTVAELVPQSNGVKDVSRSSARTASTGGRHAH